MIGLIIVIAASVIVGAHFANKSYRVNGVEVCETRADNIMVCRKIKR